jgi:phage portal protein BeeE
VTSGKLVDLLDRPGPATTQADLVSTLMCHLAIWGSAYIGKYREQGEVTQLGPLHPERVQPELEDGVLRWRYTPGTGPQLMLTEADVIHIRGLSADGLNGLSAVSQASRVLGLSDELVRHALSYFEVRDAAGGVPRPAGVLRVPDMTEVGRQRLAETLRNESRPHGIMLIEGEEGEGVVAPNLDAYRQDVGQHFFVEARDRTLCRFPEIVLAGEGDDCRILVCARAELRRQVRVEDHLEPPEGADDSLSRQFVPGTAELFWSP